MAASPSSPSRGPATDFQGGRCHGSTGARAARRARRLNHHVPAARNSPVGVNRHAPGRCGALAGVRIVRWTAGSDTAALVGDDPYRRLARSAPIGERKSPSVALTDVASRRPSSLHAIRRASSSVILGSKPGGGGSMEVLGPGPVMPSGPPREPPIDPTGKAGQDAPPSVPAERPREKMRNE